MDGIARHKHSSLLRKFVNYGRKSIITLARGLELLLTKVVTNDICSFPRVHKLEAEYFFSGKKKFFFCVSAAD
jgi:hypothetical protein